MQMKLEMKEIDKKSFCGKFSRDNFPGGIFPTT